jgi:hypothetical protein
MQNIKKGVTGSGGREQISDCVLCISSKVGQLQCLSHQCTSEWILYSPSCIHSTNMPWLLCVKYFARNLRYENERQFLHLKRRQSRKGSKMCNLIIVTLGIMMRTREGAKGRVQITKNTSGWGSHMCYFG